MTTPGPDDDPRPRLAGVCGQPIAQTRSPALFRHWFGVYGIDGTYAPLLIAPDDFGSVIRALMRAGFRGLNVTLPHKQAALALADTVSAAAAAIGAANTLTFSLDGEISADNTDGYGFATNLEASLPGWSAATGPVLMLGAGGAARAGIHALLERGAAEIRLANRTRSKAEDLAKRFGSAITVVDWAERHVASAGAALIVNTTSLGMIGKPPLEMEIRDAASGAVVTDMVYNPLTTGLLAAAQAQGLRTVDGLGMLLHQARPGFRRWFGRDPVVSDALRATCLRGIAG